jgi:hypothetical protein
MWDILSISQLYRPPRPVIGITLLYHVNTYLYNVTETLKFFNPEKEGSILT